MPTLTVRQLTIAITTTNVWTQLTEGVGGSAYTVPASSRADCKLLSANNLGANSANVSFAVRSNVSVVDANRVWPNPLLATGEYASDDSVHVLRAGEALWARAVGTTPSIVFDASILEYVP